MTDDATNRCRWTPTRSACSRMRRSYFVYILASRSRTLYVGVTNDLGRRIAQHRSGVASAFTARYHVPRLVYCQSTRDVRPAIAWEQEIKRWTRRRKVELIESANPRWHDLSATIIPSEARTLIRDAD